MTTETKTSPNLLNEAISEYMDVMAALRKQNAEMAELLRRAKDRCIKGEVLRSDIERFLSQIGGQS